MIKKNLQNNQILNNQKHNKIKMRNNLKELYQNKNDNFVINRH